MPNIDVNANLQIVDSQTGNPRALNDADFDPPAKNIVVTSRSSLGGITGYTEGGVSYVIVRNGTTDALISLTRV